MPAKAKEWLPIGKITQDGVELTEWKHKNGQTVLMPSAQNPNDAPVDTEPRVSIPISALPALIGETDDEEPLEESAADRIAAHLQMIRDDARAKIKIYKLDKNKTAPVFIADMTPEQYESAGELSYIQSNYGGGDYRIVLYGTRSNGNYNIVAKSDVSVANPPMVPVSPQSGASAGFEQFGQMMMRMFERLDQKLDQARTNSPAQDLGQMLAMMTQIKQIAGEPPKVKEVSPVQQIKELLELQGLVKKMADPNPEPPDPISKMLETAAPIVQAFVDSRNQPQQPQSPAPVYTQLPQLTDQSQLIPTLENPAPIAHTQTDPVNNQPQIIGATEMDLARKAFEMQLAAWNKKAAANEPITDEFADKVAGMIPEELWKVLELDVWFEFLSAEFPIVAPYQAWYSALRDKLLEESPE